MKIGFLELPVDERRLYIEQAAARRSVSPVMLENDPATHSPVLLFYNPSTRPAGFEEILATLTALESRINGPKAGVEDQHLPSCQEGTRSC
jgi:hypothetical protein